MCPGRTILNTTKENKTKQSRFVRKQEIKREENTDGYSQLLDPSDQEPLIKAALQF